MISRIKYYANIWKWASHYPYKEARTFQVFRDFLNMHHQNGVSLTEYENFNMFSKDNQFRSAFLCIEERRLYLDLLNPILYHNCARNKYITHKMFEGTGIKTSELYCFYQPESKVYINSNMTDIADSVSGVCQILQRKNVKECVIKVIDSSHGDGVIVVKSINYIDDDAIVKIYDGQEKKMSELLAEKSLIFESVIKQSQQLASFNESSVNCIRFMTTLYPDGSAKVIGGFIKIGRRGKCIDNAGSGGNIDAGVNFDTGEIYNVCQFDGWDKILKIRKHPDSGILIEGAIIENWEKIKAEVIRYQQAFPYCKAVGWDIAITDDGPVVVEINDAWDPTGQLFANKGWRNEIRDCYLAWKATGKEWPNRVPCHLTAKQRSRLLEE